MTSSNLAHISRITTYRQSRREVLRAATVGVAAAALVPAISAAAQATPAGATPVVKGSGRYLFVGDRTVDAVAVYSIPDFSLVGTIEGVTFGTHGGTLQLPDGRLIFADTTRNEIVALSINEDGEPAIVDRVAAELGGGVAWIAASPDLSHVAVGSLQDSETHQFLNILDVAEFENTAVEFAMNEPEEITAWLLGDPLHLYVAIGGQIVSFVLADLMAGNSEPLNTVEVDMESHGGATDVQNGRLYYVTGPGAGFDVLDANDGAASFLTQIPWDLDGFSGGRNARPRLTNDAGHIFGLMTPGIDDLTTWADNPVSNHIVRLSDATASRVEIGVGNFAYRWGMSDKYAVWAGYGAEGGAVHLLDADAASPTFGSVVKTMPLPLPTNAALPGEDASGKDSYATAITADSRYAFVSINGDLLIKVFDLESGTEIADIGIDLPLAGYDGFLTVMEAGLVPVDIWGR